MIEVEYKYTYDGHDLGNAHINFEGGQVVCIYIFPGDIVQFPRELSAWRLTESRH